MSMELADQVEAVHRELVEYLGGLSPAQWRSTAGDRPAGVIAHHVATTIPTIADRIRQMALGEVPPPLDWDAENAAHAAANPEPGQAATVALIAAEAAAAAGMVRELDDEALNRQVGGRMEGWTPAVMAERVLIGHAAGHRADIEAAVAAAVKPA